MDQNPFDLDPSRPPDLHLVQALESDEALQVSVRGVDALLAVSDRRFLVAGPGRLALNVPIDGLRRIQFDVEKDRPATMVIVPEDPRDEPQVVAIPRNQIQAAAEAVGLVGIRLCGEESERAV